MTAGRAVRYNSSHEDAGHYDINECSRLYHPFSDVKNYVAKPSIVKTFFIKSCIHVLRDFRYHRSRFFMSTVNLIMKIN